MQTLQTTRKQDQSSAPTPEQTVRALDHRFFWGVWQNTDADAQGIVRVVFDDNESGVLRMQSASDWAVSAGQRSIRGWESPSSASTTAS